MTIFPFKGVSQLDQDRLDVSPNLDSSSLNSDSQDEDKLIKINSPAHKNLNWSWREYPIVLTYSNMDYFNNNDTHLNESYLEYIKVSISETVYSSEINQLYNLTKLDNNEVTYESQGQFINVVKFNQSEVDLTLSLDIHFSIITIITDRQDGDEIISQRNNTISETIPITIIPNEEPGKIKSIEWVYSDYNYWGPNPAWRVKVDNEQVEYQEVEDRNDRDNTDILDDNPQIGQIYPEQWTKVEQFITKEQVYTWDLLPYKGLYAICDGPAHKNVVKLEFDNYDTRYEDDYDYADCDSQKTWKPEMFTELEELLLDTVNNTEITNKEQLSFLSTTHLLPVSLSFMIIVILNRRKKIK